FDGGTVFTFVLEQTHGDGHLIGRLRLSVTAESPPVPFDEQALPEAIAKIVQTPTAQWSDAERLELTRYYLTTKVDERLKALPPPRMVYAVTSDFGEQGNFKPAKGPRPVFVLHRGDVNQPTEPARPGALRCVPALTPLFRLKNPDDESSRRAALAKWISDPRN